jgi:drug/metabolite transporter superfamily protein YnfA
MQPVSSLPASVALFVVAGLCGIGGGYLQAVGAEGKSGIRAISPSRSVASTASALSLSSAV